MSTPFAVFGPGILIVTRTDTVTPIACNVGYANEFSIDLSGNTKELYGQKQFPIVTARGTIKATGKIKAAVVSGLAWNSLFFGNSFAIGGDTWFVDEPHTPATTSQAVTNVSGGIVDLGVKYASGLPLQRVAPGSEAAGKYSVNQSTGVYTLNTADEVPLLFTYTNAQTATGQKLNVTNNLIGTTPGFQLDYFSSLNQPQARPFGVRVFACVGSKLSMAFKLEDFMMPEIDFGFYGNSADQVITYSLPEVS